MIYVYALYNGGKIISFLFNYGEEGCFTVSIL